MKKSIFIKSLSYFFITILFIQYSMAQAVIEEGRYVPETDPLVLKKLSEWQDLKFGLLMHWGPYCQWGIVASWSLNPEEYSWCDRTMGENSKNYYSYTKDYENLQTTFNPVKFDPKKWAKAAKDAGMKYVVFTTKHHDGYTMYDSKYTDYKITGSKTPFSKHPKANITKEIFDAFRNEGIWAGAYFSKPDWHVPSFWDPYYPPRDGNVNYEPEENPEKWQQFVDFTHNQIMELMTDYGKVDILWLDGDWVSKKSKEKIQSMYSSALKSSKTGYIKKRYINQDIKLDDLVKKARKKQPGLIVVDRHVHGINQNYLTPENRVPEKALPYPWESNIITAGGWSYIPDDTYMEGREAIHTLVDVVSKGGNLLLNVGPSPEGEWPPETYKMLKEIGVWMKVNDEAIYNTKAMEPYRYKNICLTSKSVGTVYLIYLIKEEQSSIPSEIYFKGYAPKRDAKASILGFKTKLKWSKKDMGVAIKIPKSLIKGLSKKAGFTIRFK